MASMATMPVSRPLTIEDFEAIRDAAVDGRRYELVDGSLVVTPSPSWRHQVVSSRLMAALLAPTRTPTAWSFCTHRSTSGSRPTRWSSPT